MAYICYDKLCRFYNSVSAKERVQDINLNQFNFKVNDVYEKHEKTKTNFNASDDKDVLKNADLDKKIIQNTGSNFIHRRRIHCLTTDSL